MKKGTSTFASNNEDDLLYYIGWTLAVPGLILFLMLVSALLHFC